MKTLKRRDEIRYLQLMGSPAHTYGNAVAFIEKWLLDLFPKRDNNESIFRTIHVSSKLAHRQLRSTNNELNKRMKPAIALRPRVDFQEERFLQGTPLVEKMIQTSLNYGLPGLQSFFFDPRTKTEIKYQLNRTVMYVDVVMMFSTLMQQLNYASYIKNTISLGHPFTLSTCFESYLSLELMEMVSELADIPIRGGDGTVYKFLSYMNQHSGGPITYKMQGSTGTDEFYRYYPVNIDTRIDNIDLTDGEKNGQISENYQISMSIRMEFYTTGYYYLFSDRVFKIKHPKFEDDSTIIPIYTDILLREDINLRPGWVMLNRASTILDKDHDELDIKRLIRPSVTTAVDHYTKNGIPLEEILDIKIRRQGDILFEGVDYTIDYKNFVVHFNNEEYGFFTYAIMICINVEEINYLVKKLCNLK